MKQVEQQTCLDPFFASFEQELSSKNYKPATLETYRYLLRRLGHLLDKEGIAPTSLSTELAVEFARQLPVSPKARVKAPNLARMFVEHLIAIGVATRPPLSAAHAEREELFGNLDLYLLRQRGLSPRSAKHVLGFAARFLAHRFGESMLDLAALSARDVVAFMEHVLARKTPYRDKTLSTHLRSFFQYLFAQELTTTNLALCVPSVRKLWGARLPRYLSKLGKERMLPLDRTVVQQLERYGRERDRLLGRRSEAMFVTCKGHRLGDCGARYNFALVCQQIGLRLRQDYKRHGRGPRIHDFRHTFAVRTMLTWYRFGKDVGREMVKLTTWLGHASPANTYWYLEAVPELLELASTRITSAAEGEQ
ncbi:site-specific integrase [Rhizobium anhuiense]|uniref:site-specific integrase n=1 Tax=Rhizobium anhuiense TaxID=1184720 RepID=UPI00117B731A|nr:site-specific integrase [Rhizobium anhuiense]